MQRFGPAKIQGRFEAADIPIVDRDPGSVVCDDRIDLWSRVVAVKNDPADAKREEDRKQVKGVQACAKSFK